MYGIPDRGLCDLANRQCVKTSVLGENFFASHTLLCNITTFRVISLMAVITAKQTS